MITIRERTQSDLEALASVLERIHDRDRYPIHVPDRGFEGFLTYVRSEAAWVAVDENDAVVGHVALNSETTPAVMAMVSQNAGDLVPVYVSRLFVDTRCRQVGVGRLLLDHACAAAQELRRLPALDVLDIPTAAPAIALYERAGWTELGRVSFDLVDEEITERVFLGPAPLMS